MRNQDGSGGEYPVVKMWYGKGAGRTIEEIIDWRPDYFVWMVEKFLNVTPSQAEYFEKKFGERLPLEVIQDVPPYEWKKGDPDQLYEDICKRGHL